MPRLKCIVEYDGTHFVGWQRQLNGRSIQEAIEQAIEKIAEKKDNNFRSGKNRHRRSCGTSSFSF
jgi:tRNA pseudouridine38-40 synthase